MTAILLTLIAVVILWTLSHLTMDRSSAAWFELVMLVFAHGVIADIIFKTWKRLDWPPRRLMILFYGVVSAAAAVAVLFLLLPRGAATWYELSVVTAFFAHGVLTALTAHCYYDGCEDDENGF